MVYIKLSAHHKIVGMGTAALLVVLFLALPTNNAQGDAGSANDKTASKTETSITQSYETETRDDNIANNTTLNTSDAKDESKDNNVESTKKPQRKYYTEKDVVDIAKVLYHECRGVPSVTEQACVAWTVLNRVDRHDSTVYSVVRSPNQFAFYENAPVWDELKELARDVLERWNRERNGEHNVGRVLPKEYTYFEGRNGRNYFRDKYSGSYNIWDYSLDSPYAN